MTVVHMPPGDDAAPDAVMPVHMRLTDLGNAERLVARYRERIRYCPPRKKWLTWDGRRWAWDETGEIIQLAKQTARAIYSEAEHAGDKEHAQALAKHAHRSESASRIAAMISLAESEPGIAVLPHELDADPWVFSAANGTIDLRTGTLRDHRRSDLITKLAGAEYDPDARSELWDRFLVDATGGDEELQAYLARAVGYALYGAVTERAFFFLHGPPAGMKSTFIDAVTRAFGGYAVAADFSTWLVQTHVGGNRGDLVSLMGARLVASCEVRRGARFDEELLKRVTGGDPLKYAAKYEAEIQFAPSFALWLAANDAPSIRDDDAGTWARVRRIPFTRVLPAEKQDLTMREKLAAPEVRAAVLAWAVRGCLDWQRDGLGACAAVDESTEGYRAEMDRIVGFLDSECVFEPAAQVPTKRFRELYEAWCQEQGIKPMRGQDVAARLRKRGAEPAKSNGIRVYRGVRLADDHSSRNWGDNP